MKNYISNTPTRRIRKQGEYLVYTLKKHGVDFYLTDHPELKKILQRKKLVPYVEKKGGQFILMFKVYREKKYVDDFSLHEIALGCYEGQVKNKSFLEDVRAFRNMLNEHGMNIDHADNLRANTTKYNLSAMPVAVNNHLKGDIVSRFSLPTTLTTAYVNGSYRVWRESTVICPHEIAPLVHNALTNLLGVSGDIVELPIEYNGIICHSPEDYAACLRFMANYRVNGAAEPTRPPKGKNSKKWWYGDLKKSLAAQKELAAMDESEFQVFTTQE